MSARSYADPCGIARALDTVGDRWTLLVVRELLLGPKRYTDLKAGLGRIAPDVLAQRLRDLETAGLVRRGIDAGPGRARIYELTGRGRQLEPVLHALGRFGSTLPMPPDAGTLSPDAAIVALQTTFRAQRADRLDGRYELRLDADVFTLTVAGGHLDVERGPATGADAALETTTAVLAALVWHGSSLATATAAGDARALGDRTLLRRLLRSFQLGG